MALTIVAGDRLTQRRAAILRPAVVVPAEIGYYTDMRHVTVPRVA